MAERFLPRRFAAQYYTCGKDKGNDMLLSWSSTMYFLTALFDSIPLILMMHFRLRT